MPSLKYKNPKTGKWEYVKVVGIGGGNAGASGEGGYYTPTVIQEDASTVKISFAPSTEGMTEVPDVSIALPSGADGRDYGQLVKDYVRTEAERVAKAVGAVQTERTVNIGVMTDWHLYDEDTDSNVAGNNWAAALHAIQGMALVSRQIRLNAAVCLGDFITGDSLHDAEGWLDVLAQFNLELAEIRTPHLLKTCGNHDQGYGGSVYISPAQLYPYVAGFNDSLSLGSVSRGYGYRDFENYKLRIIVVNTAEYSSAEDYATGLIVSDAQYAWFAKALDLSGKEAPAQWQTLIFSHHPLDWDNSLFPEILAAYETGGSVSAGGSEFEYSGKNTATIIGNIHGHLHNLLKGTISGTGVKRWCCPNINYDYTNTYEGWQEDETYEKTAGTAQDTAFLIVSINLDTGVVNRVHYGAGYDDATDYLTASGEDSGETESSNLVPSSIDSSGSVYNGTGYKDGCRLNSSGAEAALEGRSVTGFIPAAYNDRIYAAGIGWDNSLPGSNYIAFYDSTFTCIQSVSETNWRSSLADYMTEDGGINGAYINGNWGTDFANVAYIRISGAAPGSGFVVQINEEIT